MLGIYVHKLGCIKRENKESIGFQKFLFNNESVDRWFKSSMCRLDLPTSGFYWWSVLKLDFSIGGSLGSGLEVVVRSGIRELETHDTCIFNM